MDYKTHCLNPVTGSEVACQLCWWDTIEKVIAHIQNCILCHFNLCVKKFTIFHMILTLFEDKEKLHHWRNTKTILYSVKLCCL